MNKKSPFAIVAFFAITVCLHAQPAANDIIVTTGAGKVRGSISNGVAVFKSIPYAAPPIGENRFAAPVPHPPWDDIRDATKQGPTAPFNVPPAGDFETESVLGKGWIKGDDFLAVNVWTPGTNEKNLPVMVYIHGGAFAIGTSDVALFDGSSFAKKGVILVSLNYRMGIEGFLKNAWCANQYWHS